MTMTITETIMKRLALLILAIAGLAGCVAVPVAGPPGVYAAPAPPAVVVQPYFSGYYYGGYYGHRRRWH